MFDLSHDHDPQRSELRPARALLTPTWIAALVLLVANDHWLKGSGLLPGVLTGKLSDFAGMLVAPTLLAVVLAAVGLFRGRRTLLACHVAVAAVFVGIQLSPAFAGQWSALMGTLGHPWTITCDPTDLIALPLLLLSWKLLVPEMEPKMLPTRSQSSKAVPVLPAMAPLQRTAVVGLSVFGLWSTVATSDIDSGDEWYEDVYGNLAVNNANDFDIALHIRPLRSDLEIDCQTVATDPGRLLDSDAFGDAVHWVLPAWTNVAIELDSTHAPCSAVWIAGEGIEPTIVFVSLGNYSSRGWAGQTFAEQTLEPGAMAVTFGSEGSTWSGSDMIRFRPRTDAPEQPQSCEIPLGESRIDWPASAPNHDTRILGVEIGVDGCHELELTDVTLVDGEPSDIGVPYGFYLCTPEPAVPFAAGDLVRFHELWSSGFRELSITVLDNQLSVAVDESGRLLRRARYLRGSDVSLLGLALGRDIVAVPQVSCPWSVDAGECSTVERRVDLAVDGAQSFLVPGKPVSFADAPSPSAMVHTAVLAYSRQLAVLDLACAEGSVQLSHDIDLAIIEEPLL